MDNMNTRIPKVILAVLMIVTTALLLVAIALGGSAQASGLRLHNNYSSTATVSARDSAGQMHYLTPGETETMGSSYTIYIPANKCLAYGWYGVSTTLGKSCTAWKTSRELWVKTVAP
jgi:hypothetical protein